MMFTTDRMLETTAIGLAGLLAVTILVRAGDIRDSTPGVAAEQRAAVRAAVVPPPAGRPQAAATPAPDDDVRRMILDMALHD